MNQAQRQKLQQVIPETSSMLDTAIIKLYFADKSRKFKFSQLYGAMCLLIDRKEYGTKYLKLYELGTFTVVFELELYLGFSRRYTKLTESFYCFPLSYGWAGLLFLHEEDARSFKHSIEQYSDDLELDEYRAKAEREMSGVTTDTVVTTGYQPHKIFVNPAYFTRFKVNDADFKELAEYSVSKPSNIEQRSNAGWDPVNQRFKLSELPKELRQLLKNAGITKKDLKVREIALMVYEILMNPTQLDSILVKMKTGSAKSEVVRKEVAKVSGTTETLPQPSFISPEDLRKQSIAGLSPAQSPEEEVKGGPEELARAQSILIPPPSLANIPTPPPISLMPSIPLPPSSINVPTPSASIVAAPAPRTFLDQIKAGQFKLKATDSTKNNMFKDVIENKQLQMKTASTLHAAIVES